MPRSYGPLKAFFAVLSGWFNRLQLDTIAYLREEVRVLREEIGPRRLRFTDAQRLRLALKGKALGRRLLREFASIAAPETIFAWHRRLVLGKENRSRDQGPCRPRTAETIAELVLRMARENSTWGYARIQGALKNLGYEVARGTIANILRRNGFDPAPERGKAMAWTEFLKGHLKSIAATDFFTTWVWTKFGLVSYHVLFFIEIATRRVHVAAIKERPGEEVMIEVAKEVVNPIDGFLRGKRFLIMDRDSKYTESFRAVLAQAGVQPLILPRRAPNMNAYAERFVRSVKSEVLRKMIFFGERSLRRAISSFIDHYHGERNHQGLGDRIILPEEDVGSLSGPIRCRKRLGGILKYYYRRVA